MLLHTSIEPSRRLPFLEAHLFSLFMPMRFNIAFGREAICSEVEDEVGFRLGNRQTVSYVSATASVCLLQGLMEFSSFVEHGRRQRAFGKSDIVLSSMAFKETVSRTYM